MALRVRAGRVSPLQVVDRLFFLRVHFLVACVRPVPHVHPVCHSAGNRCQRYEPSYRKEILNSRKSYSYTPTFLYSYCNSSMRRLDCRRCAEARSHSASLCFCSGRPAARARAHASPALQLPPHLHHTSVAATRAHC